MEHEIYHWLIIPDYLSALLNLIQQPPVRGNSAVSTAINTNSPEDLKPLTLCLHRFTEIKIRTCRHPVVQTGGLFNFIETRRN